MPLPDMLSSLMLVGVLTLAIQLELRRRRIEQAESAVRSLRHQLRALDGAFQSLSEENARLLEVNENCRRSERREYEVGYMLEEAIRSIAAGKAVAVYVPRQDLDRAGGDLASLMPDRAARRGFEVTGAPPLVEVRMPNELASVYVVPALPLLDHRMAGHTCRGCGQRYHPMELHYLVCAPCALRAKASRLRPGYDQAKFLLEPPRWLVPGANSGLVKPKPRFCASCCAPEGCHHTKGCPGSYAGAEQNWTTDPTGLEEYMRTHPVSGVVKKSMATEDSIELDPADKEIRGK